MPVKERNFVHLWYQYQAKWTAHNVTTKLSMSSQNSHSRMRYTHIKPKCRMRSKTNSKYTQHAMC